MKKIQTELSLGPRRCLRGKAAAARRRAPATMQHGDLLRTKRLLNAALALWGIKHGLRKGDW